jgi:hypothetical protein
MTNDCSGSLNPNTVSIDFVQLQAIYDSSSNIAALDSFQNGSHLEQFSSSDAVAVLQVPKNKFDDLFLIHTDYSTIFDNSNDSFSFAIGSWTDISFSEAVVTEQTAIDPDANQLAIKADFVRHIFHSAMNTSRIHALFSNKSAMVQELTEFDVSLNTNIRDILSGIGGTVDSPYDSSITYDNPARTLLNTILDLSHGDVNVERKLLFLDYLKDKQSELSSGSFVSIPFEYHDDLVVQITYHPKSSLFLNQAIEPRTYKVFLNMSMEMDHAVSCDDAFMVNGIGTYYEDDVDISSLRMGTILNDTELSMNVFQSSGYNNHDFWIFWNDSLNTPGISPFNYYPQLSDISDIYFRTNSGSGETRNWNLEFYTRKSDIEKYEFYQTKYTSQLGGTDGSWNTHDIQEITWTDESGEAQDIRQDESILGIRLTLSESTDEYAGFLGKITPISFLFNDNRTISFIF